MGFISHHITPLVINSLGRRYTHTHTHTRMHTDNPHRIYFKKQGTRRPQAGMPDLIMYGRTFENIQTLCIFCPLKFLSLTVNFKLICEHRSVHYPTRDLLRRLGLLEQGVTIFIIT